MGLDSLDRAVTALRSGQLVVFPTETVYGLGANALSAQAVARIYDAKGRPADNPVIVHVATIADARALCRHWPDTAERLAQRFWPGPLSLVLPRARHVPDIVTGGLDTVALRIPDHPIALEFLRRSGLPVAAPSANRSGRPSPTRVEHARDDLGERVAVYVDGGPCAVGLESTVVDLTGAPRILRQGGVPRADLEAVVGSLAAAPDTKRPLAPGMKYRHYAPQVPVVVVDRVDGDVRSEMIARFGRPCFVVGLENALDEKDMVRVAARSDADVWAREIFGLLRDLEKRFDAIVVERVDEGGRGAAVMERLLKAARA